MKIRTMNGKNNGNGLKNGKFNSNMVKLMKIGMMNGMLYRMMNRKTIVKMQQMMLAMKRMNGMTIGLELMNF